MTREHISYTDVVATIARGRWGRSYESIEDAVQELFKDDKKLTAYSLLYIVTRIEEMFKCLMDTRIKEKNEGDCRARMQRIWCELEEREQLHGPCPEVVKRWIQNKGFESIGSDMVFHGSAIYPSFEIPPKGTELRKQYDRWMKRKLKPASKKQSEK